MLSPSTLKIIRQTHHYSGVFLAPALLFFAITGFIQTFALHESGHGSSYVPYSFVTHLSQLHKNATLTFPVRKPAPAPPAVAKPAPPAAPATPSPPAKPPVNTRLVHLPMKLFFAVVSIGLVLSTLSGLVMAWKYTRNKPLVAGTFLAGIILPLLLLLF